MVENVTATRSMPRIGDPVPYFVAASILRVVNFPAYNTALVGLPVDALYSHCEDWFFCARKLLAENVESAIRCDRT